MISYVSHNLEIHNLEMHLKSLCTTVVTLRAVPKLGVKPISGSIWNDLISEISSWFNTNWGI